MARPSIKKRKWLYKIVMALAIMAQITPVAARPPMADRQLTKALLNRRWREFASIERARAFSDIKNKRIELKNKAGERQKDLENLFRDGKVYYDSRFYKEAIATWYEVLLLPDSKRARDDKKAESLIINAQKALKDYTESKARKEKDLADREARLARSALENAKIKILNAK